MGRPTGGGEGGRGRGLASIVVVAGRWVRCQGGGGVLALGAVTAAWRHAIVGEEVGRPSGEKQNSSKINLFINKVVYICI